MSTKKCVPLDINKGYWSNGQGSAYLSKLVTVYIPTDKIEQIYDNRDDCYHFLFHINTTDNKQYCLEDPTENNKAFVKEWLGID